MSIHMRFTRQSAVVAAVLELVYYAQAASSADASYDGWPAFFCNQFVLALSIITACVPYLKPLYLGLESGLLRSDDLRRQKFSSGHGYGSSNFTSSPTQGGNTEAIPLSGRRTKTLRLKDVGVKLAGRRQAEVESTVTGSKETWDHGAAGGGVRGTDSESQNSRTDIIRHTTAWTVRSEIET